MESRRLVVWISAGILGFQGGTLALDLINCTVLSWLWVERHGLEQVSRLREVHPLEAAHLATQMEALVAVAVITSLVLKLSLIHI